MGGQTADTTESVSINTEQSFMNPSDYLVAFSGNTTSYCIGMVDMVDSTKISAKLNVGQISKYYQIFLNSMAKTVNRFGGQVIKNIGDSLLFYFPESSKNRTFGFMSCIEGALGMLELHDHVCLCTDKEDLPCIDYRISCDYGPVVIMKPNGESIDLLGPPVNMCSKINHSVANNEIILGGDLYEMVKKIPDYKFNFVGDFNSELKHRYPLYTVTRK
ncbi:MAG: adenylate/guanylate cyclase domain-containing protein [Nitrosopumilus sp.]